jgi:hypothetical protein
MKKKSKILIIMEGIWSIIFSPGTTNTPIRFYSNGRFHQTAGIYKGKWKLIGCKLYMKYEKINIPGSRIFKAIVNKEMTKFKGVKRHENYSGGKLKYTATKMGELDNDRSSEHSSFECSGTESSDESSSEQDDDNSESSSESSLPKKISSDSSSESSSLPKKKRVVSSDSSSESNEYENPIVLEKLKLKIKNKHTNYSINVSTHRSICGGSINFIYSSYGFCAAKKDTKGKKYFDYLEKLFADDSSKESEHDRETELLENEVVFLLKKCKTWDDFAVNKIISLYKNNPKLSSKLLLNETGLKYCSQLLSIKKIAKHIIQQKTNVWFYFENSEKFTDQKTRCRITQLIVKQANFLNIPETFKITREDLTGATLSHKHIKWLLSRNLTTLDEEFFKGFLVYDFVANCDLIMLMVEYKIIEKTYEKLVEWVKILCDHHSKSNIIKLGGGTKGFTPRFTDLLQKFGPLTADQLYDLVIQYEDNKKRVASLNILKYALENKWFTESEKIVKHFINLDFGFELFGSSVFLKIIPKGYDVTKTMNGEITYDIIDKIMRGIGSSFECHKNLLKVLNSIDFLPKNKIVPYMNQEANFLIYLDHQNGEILEKMDLIEKIQERLLELYKMHVLIEEMAPLGIGGKLILEKYAEENSIQKTIVSDKN